MRSLALLLARDLPGARKTAEEAVAATRAQPRLFRWISHYAAGVVARHAGDVALAREHGGLAVELAKAGGFPLAEATARLAWALAMTPGAGELELEEALALARRCGTRLVQIGSLLGLAVSALRRNDLSGALARLREGFGLGEALGNRTLLVLLPGELADCCAVALEHDIAPEYVRMLIRVHELEPGERARDLERWPWELRIEALRGFSVRRENESLDRGPKAQKKPLLMLRLLVAQGAKGVRQDILAEMLWPDADGDAALRSLNTTLYRLRKLLG